MEQTTVTTEVVKQPTKHAQALAIFNAALLERTQGLFASNKEFRHGTVVKIQEALGVGIASAAAHYNKCKIINEQLNPNLGLGRDPKKVKPVSNGKRGRPVGSRNKAKVIVGNPPFPEAVAEPIAEVAADPVA